MWMIYEPVAISVMLWLLPNCPSFMALCSISFMTRWYIKLSARWVPHGLIPEKKYACFLCVNWICSTLKKAKHFLIRWSLWMNCELHQIFRSGAIPIAPPQNFTCNHQLAKVILIIFLDYKGVIHWWYNALQSRRTILQNKSVVFPVLNKIFIYFAFFFRLVCPHKRWNENIS